MSIAGPSRLKGLSNGHGGPSKGSKKRPAALSPSPGVESDEELNADELELVEDGESDAESDGDEDEEGEVFPELDSGEDEDEGDDEDGDYDDTSEEEDLGDEESGSESGYNSSDIDGDSGASSSTSPSTSRVGLVDDKLEKLIIKNTVKPDENIGGDEKISLAKDGVGRVVPSKLVPGGYRREYEDVEAGYGSESSTEDVSTGCPCRC